MSSAVFQTPQTGSARPVARTRCDGDVRPGKAVPSGHRGRRPDERIPLQQFRWFNAERQISWQPRNKVEVSEAGKKAANIPTAVNSAFRVVRAGLARGPALFSNFCGAQLLQVPDRLAAWVGRTAERY